MKTFLVHGFYPDSGLKIIDFYPDLTPLCVSWVTHNLTSCFNSADQNASRYEKWERIEDSNKKSTKKNSQILPPTPIKIMGRNSRTEK